MTLGTDIKVLIFPIVPRYLSSLSQGARACEAERFYSGRGLTYQRKIDRLHPVYDAQD